MPAAPTGRQAPVSRTGGPPLDAEGPAGITTTLKDTPHRPRSPGSTPERCARASKKDKGRMLARVCAPACWSRGNARRRLPPASGSAAKAEVRRERGS